MKNFCAKNKLCSWLSMAWREGPQGMVNMVEWKNGNQGDIVKHELRVTNCELRVESLKARVKIQKCEYKSTSYEFKSTSYEFKSTIYEFKPTSYQFKSMSSRIIKSIKTQVKSPQIYTRT